MKDVPHYRVIYGILAGFQIHSNAGPGEKVKTCHGKLHKKIIRCYADGDNKIRIKLFYLIR